MLPPILFRQWTFEAGERNYTTILHDVDFTVLVQHELAVPHPLTVTFRDSREAPFRPFNRSGGTENLDENTTELRIPAV